MNADQSPSFSATSTSGSVGSQTSMLSSLISSTSRGGSTSGSISGSSVPSVSPTGSPLTPDPQKSPTSLSLEALAGLASSEKSPTSRKHLAAAAAGLLWARARPESSLQHQSALQNQNQ